MVHRRFITATLLLLIVATGVSEAFEVRLRSRTFSPAPSVEPLDVLSAGERRHYFAQFYDRDAAASRGVRVLGYLPQETWIVSIAAPAANDPLLRASLRWIGEIAPTDKMPPRIAAGRPGEWAVSGGEVDLVCRLHDDADEASVEAAARALGGRITGELALYPGFHLMLRATAIEALAAIDDVMWIEERHPALISENDGIRSATGADVLSAAPFNLDGTGVNVGMWDDGRVDETHADFAGRIIIAEGAGLSSHATHVAGTFAGSGSLSESAGGTPLQWRGIAPGVTLHSWDKFGNVVQEASIGIDTYSLRVINNSWGTLVNGSNCDLYGDYDLVSAQYDSLVRQGPGNSVTIVFSGGNERDDGDCPLLLNEYGCLNPPKAAKNIITVGAINSDDHTMTDFSSWGPVDDGRVKPDIVAPGCETAGEGFIHSTLPGDAYGGPTWCGTSMSAPVVSGAAVLLRGVLEGGGPPHPSPHVTKTVLLGTAIDMGPEGPDYMFGHGRLDMVAAVRAVVDDDVLTRNMTGSNSHAIDFVVPAGKPSLRLVAAWSDPAALPMADPALVNDIDMSLTDPSGGTHLPWILDPAQPDLPATRGIDTRNNVEHLTVTNPEAGTWTLNLTGTVPDGPQRVAVVGLDEITPAPVTGLAAAASGTTVDVTWTSSTSEDAPGTMLVRALASGTNWTGPADGESFTVGQILDTETVVVAIDSLDHTTIAVADTGLTPATEYTYYAYAFDDFHNFAAADQASATTDQAVGVAASSPASGGLRLFPLEANAGAIRFVVGSDRRIEVRLFDSNGRLVRELVDRRFPAGAHALPFDGRDGSGAPLADGLYFLDLRAGGERASQRLLWLR